MARSVSLCVYVCIIWHPGSLNFWHPHMMKVCPPFLCPSQLLVPLYSVSHLLPCFLSNHFSKTDLLVFLPVGATWLVARFLCPPFLNPMTPEAGAPASLACSPSFQLIHPEAASMPPVTFPKTPASPGGGCTATGCGLTGPGSSSEVFRCYSIKYLVRC